MRLNEGKCLDCPYLGVLIREKCPKCYQKVKPPLPIRHAGLLTLNCSKCGSEVERKNFRKDVACIDCKSVRKKIATRKAYLKHYPRAKEYKPRLYIQRSKRKPRFETLNDWCDIQYHLIKNNERENKETNSRAL